MNANQAFCWRFVLTSEFVVPASVLFVYAALHDLAVRTMPNWLSAVLLIGAGARVVDHSLLAGVAASVVVFIILSAVWMRGGMGGGDMKLWAATVMLVPPLWQPHASREGGGLSVCCVMNSGEAAGARPYLTHVPLLAARLLLCCPTLFSRR